MTSGNNVRIDFHSSLGMLDFVQMISEYVARTVGLDEDSVHWVTVAVRESVVNAIKHGNCNDVRKRVHVEFTSLQDRRDPGIAILVREEGCGFDPRRLSRSPRARNIS
jgi:serine/threonine-protein kinase RsbW